jgi:transcriptional regulator with XRE-family HTH domain
MDQGVGQQVKKLRESKDWNQARLAVEADMSVSGVSMIENGHRNLSTATLAKLATALEVEVADLFPKAQKSLFQQSDQEETAELRRTFADEWHRYALDFDKWTDLLTAFRDLHAPHVERLPDNPTAEQILAEEGWTVPFLTECYCLELKIDEEGIENGRVLSFWSYKYQGYPIPEDAWESFERYLSISRETLFSMQNTPSLRQRVFEWRNPKADTKKLHRDIASLEGGEPLAQHHQGRGT